VQDLTSLSLLCALQQLLDGARANSFWRAKDVINLKKLMENVARSPGRWGSGLPHGLGGSLSDAHTSTRLEEVHDFGSNPGKLRMFKYLPDDLPAHPALVVVLHGCTQTAAGYDLGAGWSTLADRYGFALLIPEQQRSNNPNGCFTWFQPGDIQRGRGEALSIRQMVEKIVINAGVDRRRVFITGLSAGGAMTSVMLACYPEVFAGGAIVAGLPYGAAANVQQAFESMYQCPTRPAQEWGDLVRGASSHQGPWPRISVWHGSADRTVIPVNAVEILKQWTNVHGLPPTPSVQDRIGGYPRQTWANTTGDSVIESYSVTHMAHGTPLATGKADDQCGTPGPFLLEVGISSSYHIARFFGLTERASASAHETQHPHTKDAAEAQALALTGDMRDQQSINLTSIQPDIPRVDAGPRIDIGAVITQALKAAGLIKEQ
jgi:feruloyl esterase